MGQLLTPLEKEEEEDGADPSGVGAPMEFGSSQSRVTRMTFVHKNIAYMHQKNVGDALLRLCLHLPKVAAYIEQWSDVATSGEGKRQSPMRWFSFPFTVWCNYIYSSFLLSGTTSCVALSLIHI